MYVCITYVPGAYGGQRASDPLKLELRMVSSCHVGAGNQTQALYKSTTSLQPQLCHIYTKATKGSKTRDDLVVMETGN